jgi:hypothetical protein
MDDQHEGRGVARQVIACSFLALFLELMLIRWVPSALEIIAYYSNLLLLSSFFGLGLGALLAGRSRSLFGWFPLLLLVDVLVVLFAQRTSLPSDGAELRYNAQADGPHLFNYLVLVTVFIANAAVLVPIGQRIGELFGRLPVLRAYTYDLGGSLLGTLTFGAFSYAFFSPVAGMVIPLGLHAAMASWRQRFVALPLALATLGLMRQTTDPNAIWSPYYYITIREVDGTRTLGDPPADVRTRLNPPTFVVAVNHTFYQYHGTIDPTRHPPTAGAPADTLGESRARYTLPHVIRPGAQTALVLGSGGGLDVEVALLQGVRAVDAVDIDPGLIEIARRWSANGVYDDPRVQVHVDDARAFLERTERTYDCVIFGLLDSQALFSTMSNVRLDGFVYTVEGIRAGWRRVAPGGVLSLSFYVAGQHWLAARLCEMVRLATNREPFRYTEGERLVLLVPHDRDVRAPDSVPPFRRIPPFQDEGQVVVPTDDWPFLYLRRPGIPLDYLVVLGLLAAFVTVTIAVARPKEGADAADAQSFFMGAAFLLLQTKAITDCSVYLGATWVVTTAVISGVLLMVLLANLITARGGGRASYLALFCTLLVVSVFPRETILALPLTGRLAWVLLIVPLPIFFAGQLFSQLFKSSPRPAALFGTNLLGATLGGFCEYGSMVIGSRGLSVMLFALYFASWLAARWRGSRRSRPPPRGARTSAPSWSARRART